MTIEDPIEFLHKHKSCIVNQRELGADAKSFGVALKAALRQDPDVILVGEMRDLETISTALTAAETGHLVFATLHTQDTAQTVDRIVDVFPPEQQHQVRVQLSVGLQGIVTQQLLPTADGKGRVVACEVLVPTPAVRNLIREGKTHQIYSALQTGAQHGMQTMDSALAQLVREGKITPRARRGPLLHAGGAAPPDGHGAGGLAHDGHLRLQGLRPRRGPHPRRDGRRRQAGRDGPPAPEGPDRRRHRGAQARERGRPPRRLQAGQGGRPHDRHAPALDDGLVGHDAAARALRDRGADREREAQGDLGRGAQGRRGGPQPVRLAVAATPTSSTTSTWRWSPPARPAASSSRR